ncbi:hypothetical protein ACIOEX_21115 [Streptomyces sp. NPDC087850]|uniref:hypothetical protein n=1 Tax=Streptomyces sp. NPDC087850 TaxID=3365809 RepID=UPI003808007D
MSGRYLDVDELTLHARALTLTHPGEAVLRRIGSSRRGEPIQLLSVGRGSRHVLVVAGAHACELACGALEPPRDTPYCPIAARAVERPN